MISYAQNFEDVMLERLFKEVETGFYIDIGAFDPTLHSVTRHFYERGWHGVNVEPIPARHEMFIADRPRDTNLNVAIGAEPGRLRFYECVDDGALSTLDPKLADRLRGESHTIEEYDVEVVTLNSILEEFADRTIDFLKIDIEGGEDSLFSAFDLTRYRPRALVIEATEPGRKPEDDPHSDGPWLSWEGRVLEAGYLFCHFDGLNRFYLRNEDAAFASRLRLPPSVFDRFVHFDYQKNAEKLIEQNAMISTLQEAADERLALITTQGARAATLDKELQQARGEIAHQRERTSALDEALSRAHGRLRVAEAGAERRRWRPWSERLIDFVNGPGRRIAETALCQVFPPKPPKPPLRFSIVTPVLNNADTLQETIESVLSQEGVEIEYIVIDGGSTDGSVEIAQRYADRLAYYVSEPDRGMYDAIAKGFDRATGDVFAYLNADDLYLSNALQRVRAFFESNPRSQVVYLEDVVQIDGWRFPNVAQKPVDRMTLFRGHILFQDGVFFTRRAHDVVGGFNRHMRFAGDWEFWTRLARVFRFRRMAGHVSTFRVRPGQLSSDMTAYNREVEEARAALRLNRVERVLATPAYLFNILRSRVELVARHYTSWRRLFFPIDFRELPPPAGTIAPTRNDAPKCPLDGTPADALLFSSRDTRFGSDLVNSLFYHRDSHLVSFYPPLDREALKALYAEHYNSENVAIVPPSADRGSPYRNFRARNRILRTMARTRWPRHFRGVMRRFGHLDWRDRSLEEINSATKGFLPTHGGKIRFLDVGCFDGLLLDRLAQSRDWATCGIEPNGDAAQKAREKGHEVWTCEVEDVLEALPRDARFDIIHLGQTIEHFNDPLAAVIQLCGLLTPEGVMVLSTPNLDSIQIDIFGPTWAHWHPPYHRHLFSPKSMDGLARRAGMKQVRCRTYSHPSWTWLSQKLQCLGLGGAVPHGIVVPQEDIAAAESLAITSRLFFDWRGKGDYIYSVFRKDFAA